MSRFATTHWTAILDAARCSSSRSAAALEELCTSYWYPLYAFSRSLGDAHADAEDLTQAFFQHIVEKQAISEVHPSQGKFRSFLIACFKNYRSVHYRKTNAAKRGGDYKIISYDGMLAEERFASEPFDDPAPEARYDRDWALAVLQRAQSRLKREYEEAGKEQIFNRLAISLQGSEHRYDALAVELKKSRDAVKMEASRLRRRFGQLLREVIHETVENPSEVDDELRHLLQLLAR